MHSQKIDVFLVVQFYNFRKLMNYTGQHLLVLSTAKSPTAENYRKSIEGVAGYMASFNFRYYSLFLVNLYKMAKSDLHQTLKSFF